MWTNKQHIMSRLARDHRVYHVDFGSPSLPRFAWRRFRSERSGLPLSASVEADGGVHVVTIYRPSLAAMLPAHSQARIFLEFDLRLRMLRRFLVDQGLTDSILWIYHPGFGKAALDLPHRLSLYDCVDEYSEFPNYRRSPGWLIQREAELCRAADLVFTTSQTLLEKKRPLNPDHTHLAHNVGDAAHFGRALDPELRVPEDIAGLRRPVVGFIGAVSDYKLNVDWIEHLAASRPGISIVLIGPVGLSDASQNHRRLQRFENVHLLGHRPYEQLPAYVKGFDVAVIPYNLNEYTAHCFPIKFFELLATGKPVVISALPALEGYFDDVRVARDAEEFSRHCEEAVADPVRGGARRLALAGENDWDSRIRQIMERVEQRLTEMREASAR